ncbi:MAG: HD domain-containing phosphohydrolase [Pirellulaceae bacterium]
MTEKVMFVDDEPQVLDGYRRQLARKYRIECALGGEEALERISAEGPFALVVSDLNMPGMNGFQLLSKIRDAAPDTVRMMFTGTDQSNAAEAVNQSQIFRFLSKPCPTEVLDAALEAGLVQYRQTVAERTLLSGTLTGAVKVLTDVLATVRPVAFSRTDRVRLLVRRIAKEAAPRLAWRAELAALLSQLGCIGLSEEVLSKAYAGKPIAASDAVLFREHPQVGCDLLKNVPRLEAVAEIILQQEKHFDGSGFPKNMLVGEEIPVESRILKVALDLDSLMFAGVKFADAIAEMETRAGTYDKPVFEIAANWTKIDEASSLSA